MMDAKSREAITEYIEYYSPPLKRHRYRMDSVERRAFESNGSPSGLLMEYIQERERAYSGILDEAPFIAPEPDIEAPTEMPVSPEAEQPSEDKPKRKFRSLKRIEKLIYDDSAVKQGELEDEAFELLNQDGFYDEVLPIDYEEDNKPIRRFPIKSFLLYSGALAFLIGIIIVWIKVFFL